jgi:hypothetical protein
MDSERIATETIARIIDQRRDEVSISPSWVATEALAAMGAGWMLGGDDGLPTVYRLAHLQCRQMARQLLRQAFEPSEDADKATHPLFPDLQWRYPEKRSAAREEPVYIKLELMSREDWQFNMQRLRADAASRLKHADALEAWGMDRQFDAAA